MEVSYDLVGYPQIIQVIRPWLSLETHGGLETHQPLRNHQMDLLPSDVCCLYPRFLIKKNAASVTWIIAGEALWKIFGMKPP